MAVTNISKKDWTKFSNFWWFLVLIPFLYAPLQQTASKVPANIITGTKPLTDLLVELKKGSLIEYLINANIKLYLILLPIIAITFFEIYLNKYRLIKDFEHTSLGRLKASGGSKGWMFCEIWFYILKFTTEKFPILITLITFGSSSLVSSIRLWFRSVYETSLPSNQIFSLLLFLFVILIDDFMQFLDHYAAHKVGFIWDCHELHHSATEMTIFTKWRGSPLESALTGFMVVPAASLMGLLLEYYLSQGIVLPCYLFMIHIFIKNATTYIGHSSLMVVYPKPLRYIYMSPCLHWLHHSDNPKHYDCNLSLGFTFWDKMFNTYLDESHIKDITGFGVKDTEYNKNNPIYDYAFLPIIKVMRRLRNLTGIKANFI
tara:strand:+ start:109 stop:1227 length:1119 start_codon:yes stop_codon:yes gene_type:complete